MGISDITKRKRGISKEARKEREDVKNIFEYYGTSEKHARSFEVDLHYVSRLLEALIKFHSSPRGRGRYTQLALESLDSVIIHANLVKSGLEGLKSYDNTLKKHASATLKHIEEIRRIGGGMEGVFQDRARDMRRNYTRDIIKQTTKADSRRVDYLNLLNTDETYIIKVGENISKVMDALIRRVEEIVNSINEVKRILEGRLPAKPLVMPSKNGASYVQRGAPIYQIAASKVGNLRQNAYELHVRIVSLQNTLHLLIRTVYEMQ